MADDPLEELLLDADEVDRAVLAKALQGVLGIDKGSGRIVLKPGFGGLDTRRKALAYLLGAKVAVLLDLRTTEAVAPKELQAETGMPPGTTNPKLGQLREQRLASKTETGTYYVAPPQIPSAIEELRKGRRDGPDE